MARSSCITDGYSLPLVLAGELGDDDGGGRLVLIKTPTGTCSLAPVFAAAFGVPGVCGTFRGEAPPAGEGQGVNLVPLMKIDGAALLGVAVPAALAVPDSPFAVGCNCCAVFAAVHAKINYFSHECVRCSRAATGSSDLCVECAAVSVPVSVDRPAYSIPRGASFDSVKMGPLTVGIRSNVRS